MRSLSFSGTVSAHKQASEKSRCKRLTMTDRLRLSAYGSCGMLCLFGVSVCAGALAGVGMWLALAAFECVLCQQVAAVLSSY